MTTSTRSTVLWLSALLALGLFFRPVGVFAVRHGASARVLLPMLALWRSGPNAEDRATRTRGYYQGLLDEGGEALRRGFLALSLEEREAWRILEDTFHARRVDGFLLWDMQPDLDVVGPTGHVRTNALGLYDEPCELAKPSGVRRAALIGSSIGRGCGVSFGAGYEALLERRLDEAHRPPNVERIEILNFAVDGYRPTQMLFTALERCPPFAPDVYLWELSPLVSGQAWSAHLAAAVQAGVDLHYPFLRSVASEAGVSRYDPVATTLGKLAPHRTSVLRFVLETVRDHVRASGAELLVLAVPLVGSAEEVAADFAGLDELLRELDLRVVDARGAFDDAPDLGALRVRAGDDHPNEAGHRRLCDRIEAALLEDPNLLAVLTGPTLE